MTVTRNGKTVLDRLSLSIDSGERVAVLGPNGSGKSSLIKTITRECYPQPGSRLRILGREVWDLFELRSLLGIVSNDLMQTCTRDDSGREVVLSGFFGSIGIWPHHRVTEAMRQRADEVLRLLEMEHLAERNVNEMSSGEARRVLIGRALVHDPAALMLDEPTTSLDFHARHELRNILRKLAQSGSRDRNGDPFPDRHHPGDRPRRAAEERRVVCDGPKESVLTPDRLSDLFGTPVEVTHRNGYYHIW